MYKSIFLPIILNLGTRFIINTVLENITLTCFHRISFNKKLLEVELKAEL